MIPYPKIESVFTRNPETHKLNLWDWRLPEFEYLKDNDWIFTEKVDGTNIRIMYHLEKVFIGARTDNGSIPIFLLNALQSIFTEDKMRTVFPVPTDSICLYGEGYGNRIQKNGHLYRPDNGFVLFDIRIGKWWLKRETVEDIGSKLNIDVVPIITEGTLITGVNLIRKNWFTSTWGNFPLEGFVAKPKIDLLFRNGHRIITKIKTLDFAKDE
jgi:hypothetical protein